MLIGSSFPHFKDSDGGPLDAGYLYFGQPNLNPETNPISVYWDAALTQPAAQPIRTLNGYIVRDGNIANIYVGSNYSITCKNKVGILLFSMGDSNYFDPSSLSNLTAIKTVDNIAALKALLKTGVPYANVLGYYTKGDGGGGLYWYDSTDTTSTDNGGTIIVASDGGRWKLQITGAFLSVKQFGAKGDNATNDYAAIQAALDYCLNSKKYLFLPAGYYVTASQLVNRGVSIIGEGTFYSQIIPATTFPAATAILLIQPNNGAYIDFLELGRFSIQPTNGGTKYGGTAVYMNFQQTTNLSKLHMHDLYLLPGNDYSFQINNNMAVNTQGVPANSTIERCAFWEGSKLIGIGDSNMIHENIFRASGGNRCAIHLYMSDTSGTASHTVIRENNIDCPGGALYAVKGRSIKFIYNNVELSAGPGTANGSIIDIDGSSGSIPFAEVCSNHIGIFGTATGTNAIRLGGSVGASVDKNTILAAFAVANAILVTASSSNADIGFNEIQSNYTTPINNTAGVKTMGVPITLAPLGVFTNTGGGYQTCTAFKNRNGLVSIAGVVNAASNPNGLIIATLPIGYRPTTLQRFSVSAVVGGSIVCQAVEVDTSGNIVYYGGATTTRIEFNATFQTTNYLSGSL